MIDVVPALGFICFALANNGTICLQRMEGANYKIVCVSPSDVVFTAPNIKPCEFQIVPEKK